MTAPYRPPWVANPRRVGIMGLGDLGTPLAWHLARAGHRLFVYTRRGRLPPLLDGVRATQCTRPSGVAQRAEVVLVAACDAPELLSAWDGPAGLLAGLSPGKTVAWLGGGAPAGARGSLVRSKGCRWLDLTPPPGQPAMAQWAQRLAADVAGPAFNPAHPPAGTMARPLPPVECITEHECNS